MEMYFIDGKVAPVVALYVVQWTQEEPADHLRLVLKPGTPVSEYRAAAEAAFPDTKDYFNWSVTFEVEEPTERYYSSVTLNNSYGWLPELEGFPM